jgi:uncharacterized protein YajQ (UPF0234 family)
MDQLEVIKDVLRNQIESSILSKLDANFDELYSMVTSECEKRNLEIENRFLDAKEAKKLEGNELREEINSLQKQINNLL